MPTPPAVPPEQLHLSRRDRQYPYRWANEQERAEVRAELDVVLRGVDRLIGQAIEDVAGWAKSDLREDWHQEVSMHLYTVAMPRYDQWRADRSKVSTFIYVCARRHLWTLIRHRKQRMKNRPPPITLTSRMRDRLYAPAATHDRVVERIADEVLADPTILGRLGPAHVHEGRDMTLDEAAAAYGVMPVSISSSRHRAREKVRAMLADAA